MLRIYSDFWLSGGQLSPIWRTRTDDDLPDVEEWGRLSDAQRAPLELEVYGMVLRPLGTSENGKRERRIHAAQDYRM